MTLVLINLFLHELLIALSLNLPQPPPTGQERKKFFHLHRKIAISDAQNVSNQPNQSNGHQNTSECGQVNPKLYILNKKLQ